MSNIVKTICVLVIIFSVTVAFAESCSGIFAVSKDLIQNEIQKVLLITRKDSIEKLKGTSGYLFISWKFFEGNMYKAYSEVLQILGKDQFEQLGWRLFDGSVFQYHELRNVLIDHKQSGHALNHYYVGMKGMTIFASGYAYGDMHTAYNRAYAVLEPMEFAMLGWKDFLGSAKEMYELRNKIIKWDAANIIWDQYIGKDGHILFANRHFGGDELVAFMRVSAVLNSTEFSKLNWPDPSDDKLLQNRKTPSDKITFTSAGLILEDYVGQMGYMRMADKFFDGDMKKTYQVIYNKFGFHKMKWKKFNGHTWQFFFLRQKITNTKGELLTKYFKSRGCLIFATDHYKGDMKKAFEDVFSVLNKEEEEMLEWHDFYGRY